MGLRRVYRAEAECRLRVDGSRLRSEPWGLLGGAPGGRQRGRSDRHALGGPQLGDGGMHPVDSGRNFVEPYLRQVFGFLGIDDVVFISAEGLNISPEQRALALETADANIDEMLPLAA